MYVTFHPYLVRTVFLALRSPPNPCNWCQAQAKNVAAFLAALWPKLRVWGGILKGSVPPLMGFEGGAASSLPTQVVVSVTLPTCFGGYLPCCKTWNRRCRGVPGRKLMVEPPEVGVFSLLLIVIIYTKVYIRSKTTWLFCFCLFVWILLLHCSNK